MSVSVDRVSENLAERASVLWAAVEPAGSPPATVETLKSPHRKSAVLRLLGAGPNGEPVVAKRAARASIEIEARVYRDVLAQLPVSATRLLGTAPDQDGDAFAPIPPPTGKNANADWAWLFLEDAGEERFDAGLPSHRRLAAVWMASVHGGARHLPQASELPARDPDHYLALRRSVEELLHETQRNPALSGEERAVIEDVVEACDALRLRWSAVAEALSTAPATIVFGGFSSKNANVRTTAGGIALMPFDFESAGHGCPAIDLVYLDGEAYVEEAGGWWSGLDSDEFERLRGVGRVLGGLKAIPGEAKVLLGDSPSKAVAKLRWYGLEIVDGMRVGT